MNKAHDTPNLFEQLHNKTNSCICDQHGSRPAGASTQSEQYPCCSLSVSLIVKEFVSEQHGSWSDCVDGQASLDPCWSQMQYVGFVMARLIYVLKYFISVMSGICEDKSLKEFWVKCTDQNTLYIHPDRLLNMLEQKYSSVIADKHMIDPVKGRY
jgi:hypothetical protein